MDMAHTTLAVQAHWRRLRPLILKSIPFMNGSHDEADLIAGVLDGSFRLWAGPNSFALASLERYPKLVRCNLFLAGGDAHECLEMRGRVEAWGKANGAGQFFTMIRPGLDRLNHQGRGPHAEGWSRGATIYTKDL